MTNSFTKNLVVSKSTYSCLKSTFMSAEVLLIKFKIVENYRYAVNELSFYQMYPNLINELVNYITA